MVPLLLVLNLEYSFMDMPLLFGFTMSIWIALFGVFKMVGWLEMGAFLSGRIWAVLIFGKRIKSKDNKCDKKNLRRLIDKKLLNIFHT